MLLKEFTARFEKTTANFAVFKHQPADEDDLICQVYVPREQFNGGTMPQQIKVSIQPL